MADLAAMMDQSTIDRFVRRIRLILWFNLLLDRVGLGLKAAAGLLLTCGLLHVFISALPISIALACILLPVGYALWQTSIQKPGTVEAACYADRHFNGKSLLTTAVGLIHGVARHDSDFSPLIFRQAVGAITRWQQELVQNPIRTAKPFPWWTLAVALLGVFMWLQPGNTAVPVFGETEKHQSDIPPSRPEATESSPLLASIKKQESHADAAQDGQTEDLTAESHPKSQSDNQLQPQPKPNQSLSANSEQEAVEVEINEQTHGTQGRQGIGTEADANPTTRHSPENQEMAVKWIATELGTGDRYSNAKIGTALADDRVPTQEKSPRARASAASRITSASAANFSFSQQHYVAAYFHQSRSQP